VRLGVLLALLWLTAINLRTVLLGVPPTLPTLHRVLGLSYGEAGLLTTTPILVMALGALPGAFIIGRLGARSAVAAGLLLLTAGAVLRGAIPAAGPLFAFTILMAVGIAITQPALPSLVQAWFPLAIARATAIYSSGLLVGEVLAATITLPLLLQGLRLGWQAALAVWAIPAGIVLMLWLALTPGREASRSPVERAWLPDFRSGPGWRIALLMGGASVAYFGMNTWIPDTLTARGAAGLIALTLGALNVMQLPVSLVLTLLGNRVLGRRWPYVGSGLAILLGVTGYALLPAGSAPLWAGMIGVASSLVFILNLSLPALIAPGQVARLSAFMFAVGYGCAFLAPSAGGLGWDLSGQPLAALLPTVVAGVTVTALGARLPLPRAAPATPLAAFPPAP
jgi:CP family cyanate transporter-like MFS transporter